jgi:hypothetical protein
MINNPEKTCIGTDNFSEFGGPRDDFMSRFEPFQSPIHRFYDMDYRDYFSTVHKERIGFYFYDGNHSYEEQLRGLEVAEPFFGSECVVMVDDTNLTEPRQATADFVDKSEFEYRVLLDESTSVNGHPTLWNGLTILQRTSPTLGRASASISKRPAPRGSWTTYDEAKAGDIDGSDGGARDTRAALVSIVVHNDQEDEERLESVVDACLHQSWPSVEVLVADDIGNSIFTSLINKYGSRVVPVSRPASQGSALASAVNLSTGTFLSVVDVEDPPLQTAAVQMGLAFHRPFRTVEPYSPGTNKWMEEALLTNDEIVSLVPPGETVILLHENLWGLEVLPRRVLPFLERDGNNGNPPDDATAIEELRRMRRSGAGFIAFAWPAFWWLDRYLEFHDFLRSQCSCLLENERVVVFGLKSLTEAENR